VADHVAEVEITLGNGQAVRTEPLPHPAWLDAPLRFDLATVPRGEAVRALVARDRNGAMLERRELPTLGHAR
jgi:hypothetical protein